MACIAIECIVARRRQVDAAIQVRVAGVAREGVVVAGRTQVDAFVAVRVAGVARESVVVARRKQADAFAVLTADVAREGVCT